MLIVTGGLLTFTYLKTPGEKTVNFPRAFAIGIAQMLAIVPGISRSGATISAALILGVEKDRATRFSFLMVILPILGASLLELKHLFEAPDPATGRFSVLLAGFITAFLAGLVACSWMVRIVRQGKLIYFAVYCFIIGAVAVTMYFIW
jgi:undecaprenyl-diphosphatase